jgi:segregation and condensation protein A
MYEIRLEQFSGPLDLLLQLIEREELDITSLSLATVTDQYIERLEALTELPAEELADFLVVAAKLLYIKSKMLLPLLVWDQEEDSGDLETRLKMYKEYVEAAKKVQNILGEKRHTFVREKPPASALGFSPPQGFTPDKMAVMFREVLRRLIPIVKPPEALIEKTVSIHEKIRYIRDWLKSREPVSFDRVLEMAQSRAEIIVSFLALLELVKQHEVTVHQADHFAEIHLHPFETDAVTIQIQEN